MKAPEYGSSKEPPPTYAPASAPILKDYAGVDAYTGPTIVNRAVTLQFIAPPTPTPVAVEVSTPFASATPGVYSPSPSSPSSSPSPSPVSSPFFSSSPSVASSPVSVPVSVQPQITRSTDSARQTRSLQMATGSQVSGTVTQASPLKVVVDGATVDSPADVLSGATYILGARVLVQLRNPQVPIVLGVLS